MAKINVQQTDVTILKINEDDYISLTDIAKFKSDALTADIPDFKPIEFEGFRTQAGLNAFTLSPQRWCNANLLQYSK
jgi:hypothetical protein